MPGQQYLIPMIMQALQGQGGGLGSAPMMGQMAPMMAGGQQAGQTPPGAGAGGGLGSLFDPQSRAGAGMMGLAGGLLSAGAPSRIPASGSDIMSSGMSGALGGMMTYDQLERQARMDEMLMEALGAQRDVASGGGGAGAQQGSKPPQRPQPSMQPLNLSGGGMSMPNVGAPPRPQPSMQPLNLGGQRQPTPEELAMIDAVIGRGGRGY